MNTLWKIAIFCFIFTKYDMEHISHIYRNLNCIKLHYKYTMATVFNRTVCETDLIQNIIQDSDTRNLKSSYEKVNIVSLSCATQF